MRSTVILSMRSSSSSQEKKLETNKFKSIVKPLFENWTKNVFCNITLTKQRNELLPLLMNGQATVNYHFTL